MIFLKIWYWWLRIGTNWRHISSAPENKVVWVTWDYAYAPIEMAFKQGLFWYDLEMMGIEPPELWQEHYPPRFVFWRDKGQSHD